MGRERIVVAKVPDLYPIISFQIRRGGLGVVHDGDGLAVGVLYASLLDRPWANDFGGYV
jgi:hypothetical protein